MSDSPQTNVFSEARTDHSTSLETPRKALAVCAHSDDAEFGAGGTLAKWAEAGCEISLLILTDGSKGTWDPDVSTQQLVADRRREQADAAKVLGIQGELVFLDHVDGELEYDSELREEITLWIRRLQPEVVLGWDPWKRYMMHPDHRAAGWALVDGVVSARDHLFYPHQLVDGLEKHRPDAILLWAADEPDYWVDISQTIEAKIEALLCHSSQAETTMQDAHNTEDNRVEFSHTIHGWAATMGRPVGIPLAEAFKLLHP